MSDMKCPFCQQKLDYFELDYLGADMFGCRKHNYLFGNEELWQELIRTRKALDKAKYALQELKDVIACPPDISYETGVSMYADGALQEITALEQKE